MERNEFSKIITPELMLQENGSDEAELRRSNWYDARVGGKLTVAWACADARHTLPYRSSFHIRSIANGGPREPYLDVLNHRSVSGIVVLGHFDAFVEGAELDSLVETCGGRKAKASQLGSNANNPDGIGSYIQDHVWDSDLIRQTFKSGLRTARETSKPVLVALQNHRTKEIYPTAVISEYGRALKSAVPVDLILDDRHSRDSLYKNGVPVLNDEQIPGNFKAFLDESKGQVAVLKTRYPDLADIHRIQDPIMAVLSTGIKPISVRYPRIAQPGWYFQLSIPRLSLEQEMGDSGELQIGLDQAEYPVTHSVHNFGQLGKDFASLTTLFIETGDIDLSASLAKQSVKRSWMQDWLELSGTQILIAQMQGGNAQRIEQFV